MCTFVLKGKTHGQNCPDRGYPLGYRSLLRNLQSKQKYRYWIPRRNLLHTDALSAIVPHAGRL